MTSVAVTASSPCMRSPARRFWLTLRASAASSVPPSACYPMRGLDWRLRAAVTAGTGQLDPTPTAPPGRRERVDPVRRETRQARQSGPTDQPPRTSQLARPSGRGEKSARAFGLGPGLAPSVTRSSRMESKVSAISHIASGRRCAPSWRSRCCEESRDFAH